MTVVKHHPFPKCKWIGTTSGIFFFFFPLLLKTVQKVCAKLVELVLDRVLLSLLQLNQTPFTSIFLPHSCFLTLGVSELGRVCPLVNASPALCVYCLLDRVFSCFST